MKTVAAVLDVESYGLYGPAISYGLVIGDEKGNILEEIYRYSEESYVYCKDPEYTDIWVERNVAPHLGESNTEDLTLSFYSDWLYLINKYPKLELYGDVVYPVETNFLNQVITLWVKKEDYFTISPYPLLDVASFRLAHKLPTDIERLKEHLPEHNALNDARHSYRLLVEVFEKRDKVIVGEWCVEDVLSKAEELNIKFSQEEATDILKAVGDNWDANNGINWEMIEETILSSKWWDKQTIVDRGKELEITFSDEEIDTILKELEEDWKGSYQIDWYHVDNVINRVVWRQSYTLSE